MSSKFLINKIIVITICLMIPHVALQFESIDMKEIEVLILHKDSKAISNTTSDRQQLNCFDPVDNTEDSTSYCTPEFEPEKVICRNQNFKKNSTGDWACDETELKNVAFRSTNVSCEKYENSPILIIKGSCYLNYSLKLPYIDNSTVVIEAEAIAIAIFVILCLIVCIAAGFLFKREDQQACMQPNLIRGNSIISTISGSLNSVKEDSTQMSTYPAAVNYGAVSNNSFR